MIVWGKNPIENIRLAKWATGRLGIDFNESCQCFGVVHRGELIAVAIYHQYRHPNIEIQFVSSSPRWASIGTIRKILSYAFVFLGCARITAVTSEWNKDAQKFLERLGFVLEGTHPDAMDSGAALTYGLLKKNATRWIDEKAYERYTHSAAAA